MFLIKLMSNNISWTLEKNSRKLVIRVLLFFLTLFLWWISGFIFKLVLAFILLFLFPGFLVLRFLKTKDWVEALLFSILFGFTFQILLAYTLSLFNFHFLSPFLLLPSFILWLLSPTLPPFKKSDKKTLFFLSLIFLFHLVLYLYPSSQVVRDAWRNVGFLPVGDDSKHHLLIVKSILKEGKIPTSYYLYPEIPLTYPAGYHVLISVLHYFSSFDLFKLMFFFPLFSLFLLVLASFILSSRIFNKQAGYISSLLIPSVPQTIIMVTYGNSPQLLSLPFLFASLSLLFNKESKSYLLPIVFSSIFYLSPYSLFIGVISIILLFLLNKSFAKLFTFLTLTLLFSLPFYLHSRFFDSSPFLLKFLKGNQLLNLWIYNLPEKVGIHELILFLKPLNELVIAGGLLGFFSLKKKELFLFFFIFISSVFLLLLIRRIPLFLNEFGLIDVRANLSDPRIIFYTFYPFAFLFSFFISNLRLRKEFIIIFMILLVVPIHLEREALKLEYRVLTKGDLDYVDFVTKHIPKDTVIYNDYYRGCSATLIPPFTERKVVHPFLMYYPLIDFSGEREIIRNIPDSQLALEILKKENASYLTFSTGFNLESIFGFSLPLFDPNSFKQCYEKVYGNYSNWIFKINYNCIPFTYLPLFITCQNECQLPSQLEVELPDIVKQFRLFLLTKVHPSNIAYTIGFTEILQNDKRIATWPMIKMDREFLFVSELNWEKNISLKFEGEKPYIKDLMIVAEINGTNISLTRNVFGVFYDDRNILVFNPSYKRIKLVLVYNDTEGNVYFNLFNFSSKSWKPIGSIERNLTYKFLKYEIELPSEKLLFISIASFRSPLEILQLKILPLEYIFLDAETSWIEKRLMKIGELNLSDFYNFSSNVYLRGSWIIEKDKVILPVGTIDSQILLLRLPEVFKLKMTYLDRGENEININYWDDTHKEWRTLFVFNTTNNNTTKEIYIPFYSPKSGAILNLYSWKKDFEIINITVAGE
jgi:hypothetical protein